MGDMKDLHIKLDEGDLGAITDAELSYLDESDAAGAERVRRFRAEKEASKPKAYTNTMKAFDSWTSSDGLVWIARAMAVLGASQALLISSLHVARTCPCGDKGCDLCLPSVRALNAFRDQIEAYHSLEDHPEASQP